MHINTESTVLGLIGYVHMQGGKVKERREG